MWTYTMNRLGTHKGIKIVIVRGASAISRGEVMARWQDDDNFRAFFTGLLAEAPFDAFRWEAPPFLQTNLHQRFEFVLLDAPELLKPARPDAFSEHLESAGLQPVIRFNNNGGDACLIVPVNHQQSGAYGHLADFARQGPADQTHALWQTAGQVLEQQLGERPVWPNTAGAGVPWLHLRIDSRPKYYGYQPYAVSP